MLILVFHSGLGYFRLLRMQVVLSVKKKRDIVVTL